MAELVDALVSGTSGSNALEVRVFLSAPVFWGCSSVDRALRSHRRGRGFESHQLHQDKASRINNLCKTKKTTEMPSLIFINTIYTNVKKKSGYLETF